MFKLKELIVLKRLATAEMKRVRDAMADLEKKNRVRATWRPAARRNFDRLQEDYISLDGILDKIG